MSVTTTSGWELSMAWTRRVQVAHAGHQREVVGAGQDGLYPLPDEDVVLGDRDADRQRPIALG